MRYWYVLTHHQWSLLLKHQRMLHQIQPYWHVTDKSFYGKRDQTVNYTMSNCYIIYQLCISKLGIFYHGFFFSAKYWYTNIASHYVIKLLVLLVRSLSTRFHHRSLAWFVLLNSFCVVFCRSVFARPLYCMTAIIIDHIDEIQRWALVIMPNVHLSLIKWTFY